MRYAIYARTSKGGHFQDPETQLMPLREWAQDWKQSHPDDEILGLGGEYVDRISSRDRRPMKEELLGLARIGKVGGIVVYRMDRWARSVTEMSRDLDELVERGVAFMSLREHISFDRATDRAMVHVIATFAELERDIIRERTFDGLKRAKALGKIAGRHPVGCGCGHRSEDGQSVHDGPIKPVRDEHNRHVAWLFPDGRQEPVGKMRTRVPGKKSLSQPQTSLQIPPPVTP